MWIYFAVTLDERLLMISHVIGPVIYTPFVMVFCMKPKRTDIWYKRFLLFHFTSFIILGDLAATVAYFRRGSIFSACFALFRMPCWCYAFKLALKLREAAGKLKPAELSDFLCTTVLANGTNAMGPMIFFSFETVSCLITQRSLSNGQCANASSAGFWLSC